jgi:hypothetical protein
MACGVGEEADARMCSRGEQGGPLQVSRTHWNRRQTTFKTPSTVSRSPDLSPTCERILSRLSCASSSACENRMHALSAETPAAPQQCWRCCCYCRQHRRAAAHPRSPFAGGAKRNCRAKEGGWGGGGDSQRTRFIKSGPCTSARRRHTEQGGDLGLRDLVIDRGRV